MAVYFLAPSNDSPFQFTPTLDGVVFSVTVTWNLFGERWYININTMQGALVYCMPMIGSTSSYPVNLLPQINPVTGLPWTSTLRFDSPSNTFVVTP